MLKNIVLLALITLPVFLAGCVSEPSLSTTHDYLSAPSRVKVGKPVYFSIEDQRPQIERKAAEGPYIYTVDGTNPNGASSGLGEDLSRVMEEKGITSRARVGSPGEVPPNDGIIVHIQLLSWYGRLPSNDLVTEKVFSTILSQPVYAEGQCKFNSTLIYDGKSVDLGISEGTATFQVSRNASIGREGNQASAAASDKAMTQFFQALEKHFAQ